ncbi:hypothetical protein CCR75_009551 [Bremia lactucae]|uniref:BUD13 homolog n=1 Tax=Bremia lactucae TaxID=4779 RepID=A0A976FKT9_BRELC|nr:hypothetical protein CCR75_009551 [Bremia lactucae]
MTSKLEYLQRYMSGGCVDAANRESKKKIKRVKKNKIETLGTRLVNDDDAWEHSAPSRDEIEKKWELDAAEDEQPLMVTADDTEVADSQDLPVYVGSDKYLKSMIGNEFSQNSADNDDLSPPRKKVIRLKKEAKLTSEDDFLPQKCSDKTSKRLDQDKNKSLSPPRRPKNEKKCESVEQDKLAARSRNYRKGADASQRVRETSVSSTKKSCSVSDGLISDRKNLSNVLSRSPAHIDRHHRVDSLGRDIIAHSKKSKVRSDSTQKKGSASKHRRARSRSRSYSRKYRQDPDQKASHSYETNDRRQNRSRSFQSRRRRNDRSPSLRRHRSPRSSPRKLPQQEKDFHGVGRRSRSNSAKRRSSTCASMRLESKIVAEYRDGHQYNASAKGKSTLSQKPVKESLDTVAKNGGDKVSDKELRAADNIHVKTKAGLFTATEFEDQRKVAAKQKDILQSVDASELGANAETVYRDKRGRKLDMLNELVRQQEVLDGKRKRAEREEYEWGTGEVQKQNRKTQQELLEQMKDTPFARHDDDEQLERKRRERIRAFDPINNKLFQEDSLVESKMEKKMRKVDEKNKGLSKAKPKYAGPPAPPNRFGIQPGYRWDGVVRGINWEEKIMTRQNVNAAVSEEAYKYAVADM